MYSSFTLNDLQKLRILGEGTYGKCYLVQNKVLNELCVLKQIQIFGMSQDEQKQVMKQATILSCLDHPYIIKFLSLFKTQSYLNILMQYADGGDLNKTIKQAKGSHFSEAQILNWFTQISLAIKHIHDRKIIHRDLKCQNIFMTKEGKVKLGDFGIAKNLSKTLEKIKTIVGTPYYMSPEICQNKDYSIKTDIWSLGVILYQMCALKLPFQGSSLPALALKISRGDYPAITANYSRQLKMLIKNLLQNNPLKRPSISKILQNPIISKRVSQYLPKSLLVKQFSLMQINSKLLIQKQNGQDNFQQSLQSNKTQLNQQQKMQINSARSHINPKGCKTPQAQNSQIVHNLKQFVGSSKSGKTEKDKKKKTQFLKRREISEPNLAIKKYSKKQQILISLVKEQREEELQLQNQIQSIQTQQLLSSSNIKLQDCAKLLKQMLMENNKNLFQQKYMQISDSLGLAGQPFCHNGAISLLWGLQNLNISN